MSLIVAGKLVILIFILINILFGLEGYYSFGLTISIYFTLIYIVIRLTEKLSKQYAIAKNIGLLITGLLLALFLSEVLLRYVLKENLTYSERSGNIYGSPYKRHNISNFIYGKVLKKTCLIACPDRVMKQN